MKPLSRLLVLLGVFAPLPACAVELHISARALERTLNHQIFKTPGPPGLPGRYYLRGRPSGGCSVFADTPEVSFVDDRMVVKVHTHANVGASIHGHCIGVWLNIESEVSMIPEAQGEVIGFRDAKIDTLSGSRELDALLLPFLEKRMPAETKVNAADLMRTLLVRSPDSTGYTLTLDALKLNSIVVDEQRWWWTWRRRFASIEPRNLAPETPVMAHHRSMTTQYDSGRRGSTSFFSFVLALILGVTALALFLRHSTTGLSGRIATMISGRTTAFDTSVPVVVEKIQRLSRLETVVYSLDTVVEGSHSSPILPDALAGDRILLVVHGQSLAGIDLGKLKPEDVRIDGNNPRSIHVNLPASEIFVTSLDNEHSRVYSRTTGLLVPVDQNLESDTRAKAQQQLQAAALSDGILDAARRNARATITALLYGLGFQQVEVT